MAGLPRFARACALAAAASAAPALAASAVGQEAHVSAAAAAAVGAACQDEVSLFQHGLEVELRAPQQTGRSSGGAPMEMGRILGDDGEVSSSLRHGGLEPVEPPQKTALELELEGKLIHEDAALLEGASAGPGLRVVAAAEASPLLARARTMAEEEPPLAGAAPPLPPLVGETAEALLKEKEKDDDEVQALFQTPPVQPPVERQQQGKGVAAAVATHPADGVRPVENAAAPPIAAPLSAAVPPAKDSGAAAAPPAEVPRRQPAPAGLAAIAEMPLLKAAPAQGDAGAAAEPAAAESAAIGELFALAESVADSVAETARQAAAAERADVSESSAAKLKASPAQGGFHGFLHDYGVQMSKALSGLHLLGAGV